MPFYHHYYYHLHGFLQASLSKKRLKMALQALNGELKFSHSCPFQTDDRSLTTGPSVKQCSNKTIFFPAHDLH